MSETDPFDYPREEILARHREKTTEGARKAPSMHRSQFEYIAETVGHVLDAESYYCDGSGGVETIGELVVPVSALCDALVVALSRTNPLFDRERFLARTRGRR